MKQLISLYFIALFLLFTGCKPYFGDYEIYQRADLDAFSEAGYTHIIGDLKIRNEYLTSLVGLESLTYIGRDLIIRLNHSLENLQGLNNVTTIERDLNIWENHALTSLNGLDNLKFVGTGVFIFRQYSILYINYNPELCNYIVQEFVSGIQIGDPLGRYPVHTDFSNNKDCSTP